MAISQGRMEELLRPHLLPGEEIRWIGREPPMPRLFRLVNWGVPVGAGLMAVGTLLLLAFLKLPPLTGLELAFSRLPLVLALGAIGTILLGFVLIILRIGSNSSEDGHIVTTRRVLHVETRPFLRISSFHLADLTATPGAVDSDGTGVITLRAISPGLFRDYELHMVPDAGNVCVLIDELRALLASEPAPDIVEATAGLPNDQREEALAVFGSELLPGERIEWFGRMIPPTAEQRKRRRFQGRVMWSSLLELLGGLLLIMSGIYVTTRGYWYILIPCLLFGLFIGMQGGCILWFMWLRPYKPSGVHWLYAVTDRRVLSFSDIAGRQIGSVDLSDVLAVECNVRGDGVGGLVLLPPGGEAELRASANRSNPMARCLINIPDAEAVKALIERLKSQSN